MQPDAPYPTPTPAPLPSQPSTNQAQPDYSFLDAQPKKKSRLPFSGNSLRTRIIVALVALLLLVILLAVVKSLITTKPFNSNDYLVVVERQHEMLHILTTDVTSSNLGQLSPANQNFVSTASLALQTAQTRTLGLLADYKQTVSPKKLATVFDSAVDAQLTNSLSTNSFNSTFQSQMTLQLGYYKQELKAAYATTNVTVARSLISSEFNEAKLLQTALSSPTS